MNDDNNSLVENIEKIDTTDIFKGKDNSEQTITIYIQLTLTFMALTNGSSYRG